MQVPYPDRDLGTETSLQSKRHNSLLYSMRQEGYSLSSWTSNSCDFSSWTSCQFQQTDTDLAWVLNTHSVIHTTITHTYFPTWCSESLLQARLGSASLACSAGSTLLTQLGSELCNYGSELSTSNYIWKFQIIEIYIKSPKVS